MFLRPWVGLTHFVRWARCSFRPQIKHVVTWRGPFIFKLLFCQHGRPWLLFDPNSSLSYLFSSLSSLNVLKLPFSLWCQRASALSVAWLSTAGFIALTCNWVFLWFLTSIDPVQWNQWASLWSLSFRPSLLDLTSPSPFSTLDHPSSRLKMKGSRFIMLVFFNIQVEVGTLGIASLNVMWEMSLCQLLVYTWLSLTLVPLSMCSSQSSSLSSPSRDSRYIKGSGCVVQSFLNFLSSCFFNILLIFPWYS